MICILCKHTVFTLFIFSYETKNEGITQYKCDRCGHITFKYWKENDKK